MYLLFEFVVYDPYRVLYLCSCQSSSPIPNSWLKLNLESADGEVTHMHIVKRIVFRHCDELTPPPLTLPLPLQVPWPLP